MEGQQLRELGGCLRYRSYPLVHDTALYKRLDHPWRIVSSILLGHCPLPTEALGTRAVRGSHMRRWRAVTSSPISPSGKHGCNTQNGASDNLSIRGWGPLPRAGRRPLVGLILS